MFSAVSLLLMPLLSGANRANDWDVACKGECSYNILDATSGASNAVSNITTAGGWTILSCDANSLAQDIRLVCQSLDCEHLFEGHGAVDTLIRLPQSCGLNAFARGANIQVDANQSLPADIKATISLAGNITSTVFIMSVDTNFAAIDSTKTGPVSFSLEGYNFPVENITPPPTKRDARGLKIRNWTAFNETNIYDFPPLNIDDTFPLLSASINCDHFSASVSASIQTKVDATVSVGLIATGTVIPPVIDEFAVFSGLDASVVGTLDLTASALGTISTSKTILYSVALTGINFPGCFSLGPTFAIYGDLKATLDADFDLKVDLAYNLNTRAYYPPDTEPSTGDSKPATTSTTLNINGDGNTHMGTTGNGASGEIDACVDIGAALSVNIAAEGLINILGISALNSTKYALYSDEWDLYNKCASASGSTKREVLAGVKRRAVITCPTSSTITSTEEIIDEIIQDIQSIGSL